MNSNSFTSVLRLYNSSLVHIPSSFLHFAQALFFVLLSLKNKPKRTQRVQKQSFIITSFFFFFSPVDAFLLSASPTIRQVPQLCLEL
ncbi:MAG: hypothetical protein JOS17DRAFT_301722 [Linnemannia elongata]|nr:MAG: hypothetical protein JOS17DRAFT_301722 [Linnemannia elongata]